MGGSRVVYDSVDYSAGPNGRDEGGGGDDVDVSWLADDPRPLWQAELALRARELGVLLALSLAGCALAVAARRQRGPREALLVLVVAAPFAWIAQVGVSAALVDPGLPDPLPFADVTLAPPDVALRATCVLAAVLASASLRLAVRAGTPAR